MSMQDRQEFEELLCILIPDNTPKQRVHFPGQDITPERKQAFVKQFMNLWDKCNAEPTVTKQTRVKRHRPELNTEDAATAGESAT